MMEAYKFEVMFVFLVYTCHVTGSNLRLTGGIKQDRGIVEILRNGTWGTVCSHGWTDEDAGTICRLVGYPFSGKLVPSSLFSYSSEDVWSYRLRCGTNDSTNISDCNLDEVKKAPTNCTDFVSVWCFTAENGIILLDGDAPNKGRVEMLYNNIIGTICDDHFGNQAADVTCNMIGYRFGGIVNRRSAYGPGDNNILLDDVQCTGSEPRITSCNHGQWLVTDCSQEEIVGVTCFQGQWGEWTNCSKPCGGGKRIRFVECEKDQIPCALNLEDEKCNEHPCPVDGNWGAWSDWTHCPVTCGDSVETRSRDCDNPKPDHGGMNCSGDYIEKRECTIGQPCAVDGNWSDWSKWTDCSFTCGNGTQMRNRECNNPEPEYGGLNCSGSDVENEVCYTGVECPVEGVWGFWSQWSACNAECDCGTQIRSRQCDNLNGGNCTGEETEIKTCLTDKLCYGSCGADQYLCNDQKTCILKHMSCDGVAQCPDGDDEDGCLGILFLSPPTVISLDNDTAILIGN